MKVLIYGWYGHNNTGDNLFIEAFHKLFPEYQFEFTDYIAEKHLQDVSAIFFGGGSFLDVPPNIAINVLDILKTKTILYIGIGAETNIHPIHIELLKLAKLVAIRSNNLDQMCSINTNTIYIPDLVYFLANSKKSERKEKSILVLPNISVIPCWADQYWQHSNWNHFKVEFAQFLDYLIENKYSIDMLPMSTGNKLSDFYASAEIINQMKYRSNYVIENKYDKTEQLIELFSKYSMIITQRYHGMILAELARTPYISIHHHDKLKLSYLNEGASLSYYEISKQNIIDQFNDNYTKYLSILPIEGNRFSELKQKVFDILNG